MTAPSLPARPPSPGARLWKAVRANDVVQAKALLDAGTSPQLTHSGDCLLSRALLHPSLDMAWTLIAAGARLDGPCSDGSLLTRASRQGHFELYRAFHSAGIDLQGPLPARFDQGTTPAGAVARHQNAQAMRELAAMGMDIRFSVQGERREMTLTAWCESAPRSKTHDGRDAEWWEVVVLLLAQPVDAEGACQLASDIVMKSGYLIGPTNGVLPYLKRSAWWTPNAQRVALCQSIERGHTDEVDALLAEGVPLDAHNSLYGPYTHTPLATQLCRAMREKKYPRRFAKAAKRVEVLLKHGADACATQDEWLLHLWAAKERDVPYVPIIRALCKSGADACAGQPAAAKTGPLIRTVIHWTGSTLAHFFAYELKAGDLKALLKDVPGAVNLQDDDGLTPLGRALMPRMEGYKTVERNAFPTVQTLLDANADASILTYSGKNLLHLIALSYNHWWVLMDFEEVVMALLQACPALWTQTNAEGKSGGQALIEVPQLADNPFLLARLNQGMLDRVFPASRMSLPQTSKPRL